jgi:hypothetical protein
MQRLEVSGAVRPLKWPLGVKWLIMFSIYEILQELVKIVVVRCIKKLEIKIQILYLMQ